MTDNTPTTTLVRAVVADQRDALIRAEVLAGKQREALEQAVVQAVRQYAVSVDEASEASGLRVDEIRELLAIAPNSGDLADLSGLR